MEKARPCYFSDFRSLPCLLLVYLWWFVATPAMSNKLSFLGDIHFEKILVFIIFLIIVLNGKIKTRVSKLGSLLIIFWALMLCGYLFSPYQEFHIVKWWLENYWKLMVFYYLSVCGISNNEDLVFLFKGFIFISFFYQLHSWFDYINGGSYVFQQGVKRIIGVWSGGGLGSPNGFGYLAMFSVPFGIFLCQISEEKKMKWLARSFVLICLMSIVFSGTRAAIVSLIPVLFRYWRKWFSFKGVFVLSLLLFGLSAGLPEQMKHRYLGQIFPNEEHVETKYDKISEDSASSRIDGLVHGWKLGLKRPVLGYGPGASALARKEVTPDYMAQEMGESFTLQLHNLYGQIISETGFIGALVFLALILTFFSSLRGALNSLRNKGPFDSVFSFEKELIENLMLSMLAYGFFAHTLYGYQWLLVFSLASIYSTSVGDKIYNLALVK